MDEDQILSPVSGQVNGVADESRPRAALHYDEDVSSDSKSSLEHGDHSFDGKRDGQHDSPDQTPEKHGGTRRRMDSIKQKAKRKSKRIIDAAKSRTGFVQPAPEGTPLADLDHNPAFQPAHLVGNQRSTIGGTADKVLGAVHTAGKAVIHPGHAAKRKAAATVAIQDRPYLSQEADKEFLDAHADLSRAASSNESEVEEELLEEKRNKIDEMEIARDGRKVAWDLSRHMQRVRVVEKPIFSPPKKEDFTKLDQTTGKKKLQIVDYVDAHCRWRLKSFAYYRMGNIDPQCTNPFDKDILIRYVERILIASSPYQSWFATLRSLYRWEDPAQTAKWAVVWFLIWWADICVTFCLCWIAFIVLENKFRPQRVENLRQSYERAKDNEAMSFRFDELINKHGSGNWVDPFIEEAGPWVQMQLSDMADFLEILMNFFQWRAPRKTWATLFWWSCAVSLGLLTSTGYSVKIIWMFCLLSFFLGRPIASKHPQYRHSTNALRWIFWDIPNDADWALMYLRKHAQETRAKVIADKVEENESQHADAPPSAAYIGTMHVPEITTTESGTSGGEDAIEDTGDLNDAASWRTADSSTSILGGLDILSFRCRYQSHVGRLIIFSSGLRFERISLLRSKPGKELWRREWGEVCELRKLQSSSSGTKGKDGLEIVFKNVGSTHPTKETSTVPGEPLTGRSLQAPSSETDNQYTDLDGDDDHDHELCDENGNHRGAGTEQDERRQDLVETQRDAEDIYGETEETVRLDGVQSRDRAFNCVLGFSGLKFQVLQPLATESGSKTSKFKDKFLGLGALGGGKKKGRFWKSGEENEGKGKSAIDAERGDMKPGEWFQ